MPLPDLDTSNIGVLAFWNHLDNGASSIDPSETTSKMASYQEYSNGVDGTYSLPLANGSRQAKVRVKDDGWILAWLTEDKENYALTVGDPTNGPWDLMNDHTSQGYSSSVTTTWLVYAIKDLRSALSNSGASTFNDTDVAHDWYWSGEESATNLTLWAWNATGSGGISTDITWPSDGSVSTVHRWDAAASVGYNGGDTYAAVEPPSGGRYDLALTNGSDKYGSADLLSRGWAEEGKTTVFSTGNNGDETHVTYIAWE